MVRLFPLLLLGCFPRVEPAGDRPDTDADTDIDTDADGDADTDTDTDVAPTIRAVAPSDGTTRGGTDVLVRGSGFTTRTRVWFGDAEATVTDVADDGLRVTTPSHAAGAVEVSVGRDEPEDSVDGAWTYWTDAGGKTEAIVLWYYFYDSFNAVGGTYGLVYPIEPADAELYEIWAPGLDSCGDSTLSLASWDADVTLTDETGEAYTMTPSSGSYGYEAEGTTWSAGLLYSLAVRDGTTVPDFDVDELFRTPASFRVTSPDLVTGLDLYLSGWPLNVQWSGTSDDFVLIWVHSSSEDVYCVAKDDGDFDVPASAMDRFSWGDTLQVAVGRHSVGEAVLAHDNGVIRGAGMYIVSGYLLVQ